ncbi:MFS family permease [Saccharopolyspora gloriosae]|uniref:MFS family permease n=1 Tax=Saccharopolyspora gloriosae TaxID=455344 RepID=A0A840NHI4_9PSEU|nr:MFS family permease [Saccharopolyspora gloriosae]
MTAPPADTRDGGPRLPRGFVATIAAGSVLQALNASTMTVALIDIRDAFDAGAAASWLISGLYLATAVGSPTAGRLADRVGARRVFLVSLALTALSSLLAPLAPDLGWLIALRILLGLGTCAAFPAGVAMLRAESDRRGMALPAGALSLLAIAGQVMVAFGPVLGGVLVTWQGWQAIFLINVPLALAVTALAWKHLPADPPRERTSTTAVLRALDLPGAALFTAAAAVLMLFLLSLATTPNWWLAAALVVLVAAFAAFEARVPDPFADVRMLARNRALAVTYLRTALTYVAFYTVFYGYPMWLQNARGLSPDAAGLVVLPIALLAMVAVAAAGPVMRRSGHHPVLVAGSVALLAGGLGLTWLHSASPLVWLLLVAAVLGVPNGFNNIGNQAAMYRQADAADAGMASGLYRTSQYVGANIAAAVIELGFAGPAADAGLHRLGTVVAVISAALLAGALLEQVLGHRRGGRRSPTAHS